MEAWGIIMTAFTLFGMLALTIGNVTTDPGGQTWGTKHDAQPDVDHAVELKRAA